MSQSLKLRTGPAVLLALLLCGCDSSRNTLADVTNYELAEQAYRCRSLRDPAPGAAISCNNVVRECSKRSDTAGYRVC